MMEISESPVHAIILAAGKSSRMGKPKQLLPFGNHNLLEIVIHHVLAERFSKIYTVIGCDAETIQNKIVIKEPRFHWSVNQDYEIGQSSSLRKAIESMDDGNKVNTMVFLGDLPLIERETIQTIFKKGRKKLTETCEPFVIQPKVNEKIGHPVFFGNIEPEWFNQLQGDQGAKPLLKQIRNRTALEVLDEGILFDIDTPEDYEKGLKMFIEKDK